ncbi:hypothetical protein RKD37_000032 [Streptomyces ambofaciens]
MVRNTKAFREAVAETLAELARRGVTLTPATVEDTIERNVRAVADQLGIQARSAWRYFDAAALADTIAHSVKELEDSSADDRAGQAPMPPKDNPELALILAGVPDALAQTGGDLYAVILNVAVNAWTAGHIHGEDGCEGCEGGRGPHRPRLAGPHAHPQRDAAGHHQMVRPRRVDPRHEQHRLHCQPHLTEPVPLDGRDWWERLAHPVTAGLAQAQAGLAH